VDLPFDFIKPRHRYIGPMSDAAATASVIDILVAACEAATFEMVGSGWSLFEEKPLQADPWFVVPH
jgi:hypothetical protein